VNLTRDGDVDGLRRCFQFRKSERGIGMKVIKIPPLGNCDFGDIITDRFWYFRQ
jgi:hypothetical protein